LQSFDFVEEESEDKKNKGILWYHRYPSNYIPVKELYLSSFRKCNKMFGLLKLIFFRAPIVFGQRSKIAKN
jgi:hypothetical protein